MDAQDGYVGLEVNPHLAHDTKGAIAEARPLVVGAGSAERFRQGSRHRCGSPCHPATRLRRNQGQRHAEANMVNLER